MTLAREFMNFPHKNGAHSGCTKTQWYYWMYYCSDTLTNPLSGDLLHMYPSRFLITHTHYILTQIYQNKWDPKQNFSWCIFLQNMQTESFTIMAAYSLVKQAKSHNVLDWKDYWLYNNGLINPWLLHRVKYDAVKTSSLYPFRIRSSSWYLSFYPSVYACSMLHGWFSMPPSQAPAVCNRSTTWQSSPSRPVTEACVEWDFNQQVIHWAPPHAT